VHAGRFELDAVMRLLAAREINDVLVEAGATLAGALLAAGLVDELVLYMAPVLLGAHARPLFDGLGIESMTARFALEFLDTRRIGEDLRLTLRPKAVA